MTDRAKLTMIPLVAFGLASLALASGCSRRPEKTEAKATAAQTGTAAAPGKPAPAFNRVQRQDFNRIAAELALPIFWIEDKNKDDAISPDELAILTGIRETSRDEWIVHDKFAPGFLEAYERIVKVRAEGHTLQGLDERETKRRQAVLKELSQGQPTLVASSFKSASEEDRAILTHLLKAAALVERLYQTQKGSARFAAEIPAADTASKMLFYRNHGSWCVAPQTEADPDCNAIASRPPKISGLYPEKLQAEDPKFCKTLESRKDSEALLKPFVVVREDEGGKLTTAPYNEAFKDQMEPISHELKAAAEAITTPDEAALKAYLTTVSQAYLDNDWTPADEAWAKMNAQNSKWFLRIQPDEVYFEPCSRKAGFHVELARINQASLEWQTKLDPLKMDMENALAALGGKPYKARRVSFHLPDFIDVILNEGDARASHGATLGQSLPNWGPVKEQGRGRTMAATNLYTDADSKKTLRAQTESMLCAGSMAAFTDDQAPALMTTVLHEAAHNLGPQGDYKVGGKSDRQIFGGPLASMLEELKAQTSALFFTEWLVERGVVQKDLAEKAHVRDLVWSFGHISRGMYQDAKPRPYSQLAAIQLGFLIKEGAVTWNAGETAANKSDHGCLSVQLDKFPAAIKKMGAVVVGVKARGDKKTAEALRADFVDKGGAVKELLEVIQSRWLRSPKASFVYAVEL